jgi:hypothetical protein
MVVFLVSKLRLGIMEKILKAGCASLSRPTDFMALSGMATI